MAIIDGEGIAASILVSSDEREPEAEGGVEHGIALCLSGGGYRAMLFHLGALWRLYELRLLPLVQRVSSVSGGSITAALLGLKWSKLSFEPGRLREDFVPYIVSPIRALADQTIDIPAIARGKLLPGTVGDYVARAYRKYLFGCATLQNLPEKPRFIINATNVQSGALWRFSRPYMRDWRVGVVERPRVPLATAVAASSAFPPVLSPLVMKLHPSDFTPGSGADLEREPFTSHVTLTDGGVYDNLGLETAWKRYDAILVSDGGGKISAEESPSRLWSLHAYRVNGIIDNQVRSLRKRQLIDSYKRRERAGAYWGIRTDIRNYGLPDALDCPVNQTTGLADIRTRLKRLHRDQQKRLINWGYAVADAALRRHFDVSEPKIPAPTGFPYAETPIRR
jgi:NTE family protein